MGREKEMGLGYEMGNGWAQEGRREGVSVSGKTYYNGLQTTQVMPQLYLLLYTYIIIFNPQVIFWLRHCGTGT